MSVRPVVVSTQLPDTVYDYSHPYQSPWWNNMNDRVAYQRAFQVGNFEVRQIAQAMLTSNPATPDAEIRQKNMNAAFIPPKYGYRNMEFTIEDILDTDDFGHLADSHSTDFSGRLSNIDATSRPGIFW